MEKSHLMITPPDLSLANNLANTWGATVLLFPIIYLGLPLSDKPLHKPDYLPLIHKVSNRLSGWSASLLSMTGRIVLINSVLTSLPVYFMTAFLLPKWVINEIDGVRRNFLWHGCDSQSKKIHLAN